MTSGRMNSDCNGQLYLLLHAHLPFVRNPHYDRFLEENWLFEALTETYLPLVQALSRLAEKGVPGVLNLSVSPTLLAMLSDGLLLERYSRHLQKLQELASKELKRLSGDSERLDIAKFYAARIVELSEMWENRLHRDIVSAFASLERRGKLALLTCVGTHPFLPAYQSEPEAIRLQLRLTTEAFRNAFGRNPKGVWLPECGYFDGLDAYLAEQGFEYFFMETHGILLAQPAPKFGVFAPVRTPAGLLAFGREQSSSVEVWSRERGYPGHPDYREFYKDLSQELPRSYLGDYFFAGNSPIDSGFKYYRITGGEDKALYHPWQAMNLAREHARLFVANRERTATELALEMDSKRPCILCPYDAELFGHWWFEGPQFIESVFERTAASSSICLASVNELSLDPRDLDIHRPIFSSWGENGFASVWVNSEVDFIYPKFFRMFGVFKKCRLEAHPTKFQKRLLAQMVRELSLFQASDWAFMIHNHSAADYAKRRLEEHERDFMKLAAMFVGDFVDESLLREIEDRDNLFPWIFQSFAERA